MEQQSTPILEDCERPVLFLILGPVIYTERNISTVVGIVSYGYGCATPDVPGYYANVNKQLNWLKQVLSKDTTTCQINNSVDDDEISPILIINQPTNSSSNFAADWHYVTFLFLTLGCNHLLIIPVLLVI